MFVIFILDRNVLFISSWHDLYFHKVTWFVKSAQVQIRQIRAQKREQSSIVLKKPVGILY